MTFVKTLAVGTFLASTLVAGSAFAKSHDQGQNSKGGMLTASGENVQAETVAPAQTLGGLLGNRPAGKGPR